MLFFSFNEDVVKFKLQKNNNNLEFTPNTTNVQNYFNNVYSLLQAFNS